MELGASKDGDGFVPSHSRQQASAHALQLFIIEGSITIAFGLLVPFILADYPSRWAPGSLDERNRADLVPMQHQMALGKGTPHCSRSTRERRRPS